MRIQVRVNPRSSFEKIEKLDKDQYKVWVTAPPRQGGANLALIKLLAKYFGVSKSRVEIIGGKTVRDKLVEIFN